MSTRMGEGGAHAEIHVAEQPGTPPARAGAGGVHHVALRTPTFEEYDAWAERLSSLHIPNSGKIDRYWFRSLYFREPNGILFEIASDGPGFAVDEDAATLGEKIVLAPFLEPQRAADRGEPQADRLSVVHRLRRTPAGPETPLAGVEEGLLLATPSPDIRKRGTSPLRGGCIVLTAATELYRTAVSPIFAPGRKIGYEKKGLRSCRRLKRPIPRAQPHRLLLLRHSKLNTRAASAASGQSRLFVLLFRTVASYADNSVVFG